MARSVKVTGETGCVPSDVGLGVLAIPVIIVLLPFIAAYHGGMWIKNRKK